MLLIHQAGSVRVGEVIRYTITYTPAAEKIRPLPEKLFVKLKNTSATPLRAAYLHGPYTLYTSCYPSTFDPNVKSPRQDIDETPQFEPYLKAGGSWDAVINVPQSNHTTYKGASSPDSVTWIVEIISQVIFSSTASVGFELLVGRDKKSTELSFGGKVSTEGCCAAQLPDHWSAQSKGKQVRASKGVYSKAITLLVDDTASLWNYPPFPTPLEGYGERNAKGPNQELPIPRAESPSNLDSPASSAQCRQARKKIHLVILTHGLHSNLGADMLYLKESIDAAARKPRGCTRDHQRHTNKSDRNGVPLNESANTCETASCNGDHHDGEDDNDVEQVIVRGFPGNAVRTERGIQYLGKRLAKYVLLMTYPDQPHLPGRPASKKPFSNLFSTQKGAMDGSSQDGLSSENSAGYTNDKEHAYQISSISFIGHSLGGLVQTYAIAYIQKHYPGFFDSIKPINFVALATPFLGLSHENPMYVRFALDLGLVGRTGQDLGLSWTAPRVRSGWETMIGGKGDSTKPQQHSNAGSKPLLRILPCGPAHEILSKFQNRTVYCNVVNDGIVPLQTSCLLFLDWKGLDRVEKARRGNGIVGTMAEWGWAELTGANSKSPRNTRSIADFRQEGPRHKNEKPETTVGVHKTTVHDAPSTSDDGQNPSKLSQAETPAIPKDESSQFFPQSSLGSFFSIFRPKGKAITTIGYKQTKIYKRSQTLPPGDFFAGISSSSIYHRESLARNNSPEECGSYAPPRTTFFESASDLLMPPLPPLEFLVDPESRAQTIFHDRIYHPEDIPPPLPTKHRTLTFASSPSKSSEPQPSSSSSSAAAATAAQNPQLDADYTEPERGLKIEERIARAYHRDLSWRKVLVRLEPDAHNNIIVRRMFTNAYGWPVVKHLVETHFGGTSVPDDISQHGTGRADLSQVPTDDLREDLQEQPNLLEMRDSSTLGHFRSLLDDTTNNHGLPDTSTEVTSPGYITRAHTFQADGEHHRPLDTNLPLSNRLMAPIPSATTLQDQSPENDDDCGFDPIETLPRRS